MNAEIDSPCSADVLNFTRVLNLFTSSSRMWFLDFAASLYSSYTVTRYIPGHGSQSLCH